jgi:hypothetical protein
MGQFAAPDLNSSQTAVPMLLLVFLLMVIAVLRNRQSIIQRVERYLPARMQARGPRTSRIHGGEDIIQELDRLVLWHFDVEAARWNHSEMQTALELSQPRLQSDIRQLIAAYKAARYSPQLTVDAGQLHRAEHLLQRLLQTMSATPSPMSNPSRELST